MIEEQRQRRPEIKQRMGEFNKEFKFKNAKE